jgi:predicted amidohydrolase YtcJ
LKWSCRGVPVAASPERRDWFYFEENDKGSIEAGKLADLVVLDKPYLEVSDEELKRMHPLLTIVAA